MKQVWLAAPCSQKNSHCSTTKCSESDHAMNACSVVRRQLTLTPGGTRTRLEVVGIVSGLDLGIWMSLDINFSTNLSTCLLVSRSYL
jgi:hypothetical protein